MDETKKMKKGFYIFILIFGVLVLLFIRMDKQNVILGFLNSDNSKEHVLNNEKIYNGTNLFYFNSKIIKWEDNIITYLNEDGSNIWVKEFNLIEPEIIFGSENIYIIDKASGDVFQLDMLGGTQLKLQLDKPIFNLKESHKNIIIHCKNNNEESIEFLNMKGKKLAGLSTEEKILTYSMQEDGTNYIYSTIQLEGSNISSRIYVNTVENKNKYMVDFQDEIIIYTDLIKNAVLVITDAGVYYIESGEIKWSKELKLIRNFQYSDDKLYILYENNLDVIDLNGNIIYKTSIDAVYNKILLGDGYTVLYGDKELLILQEGKEVLKYTTEGIINKISLDKSNIIISYEDRLEVYSFN